MRSGLRQSMPSSSIDSCATLIDTLPLSACGQTKLQAFGQQAHAVAVVPEQLDQVAAASAEGEHVVGI